MQYTLKTPKRLSADILLPPSKSISNRALIINAIAGSGKEIKNLSTCDDTRVMQQTLAEMPEVIDVGGSGSAMRFLTAYLATQEETHVITGSERMKQRPIGILVDALRMQGAKIEYLEEEGFPPLRITGRQLEGGRLEMRADVSSQYISAILMIAPILKQDLELKLIGNIASRPYIDLTICVMRDFGAKVDWIGADTIKVERNGYSPSTFIVESDWTAASYWYELLALSRDIDVQVCLQGLIDGSRQGDATVRYLFSMMGIKTKFGTSQQGVPTTVNLVKHDHRLPRMDYNFVNQPDIAQTVIVTCCLNDIPFCFKGLRTLRIKECDRIEALQKELRKLGYVVRTLDEDCLEWDGERGEAEEHPIIETYDDHRMALAFAPACMVFPTITINHPEVVTKSYPNFWEHLEQAGIELIKHP